MKLHWRSKDGGPASRVWMYGIESKKLGSVLFLRFENGTRDVFHNHAFDCVSWILNRGRLEEEHLHGGLDIHRRSLKPIWTWKTTFHQVRSVGRTWVLTFRGPWLDRWQEYIPERDVEVTLFQGRKEDWN